MKHELYRIELTFHVCPGMKDKVLDEIKGALATINKTLDHASNLKITVTHGELE